MTTKMLGDLIGDRHSLPHRILGAQVSLDLSLFTPMVSGQRLGRFIKASAPDESDYKIQLVIDIVIGRLAFSDNLLRFAVTAEDIRRVYVGGPHSCMNQSVDYRGVHPCMAYAYPYDRTEIVPSSGNTLAVAYLGDIDRAKYRAVVCTNLLSFHRCYGPGKAMEVALQQAGYSYCQSAVFMLGQKLSTVRRRDDVLLFPYIDGSYQSGIDCGDHIEVSDSGDYDPRSDGIARDDSVACDDCGSRCSEGDISYIEHVDRTVCPDCLNSYIWARITSYHEDYVPDDDVVYVNGTYFYTENPEVRQCSECDEWYLVNHGHGCGDDEEDYGDDEE